MCVLIEDCREYLGDFTADLLDRMIRLVDDTGLNDYVEKFLTTNPEYISKTIRGMDGRRPPSKDNEVLEVEGVTFVEDGDKAKEFAKTYKGFVRLPVKKEDRKLRRYNRKHMKRKPHVSEESEQAFTMMEMERVIK